MENTQITKHSIFKIQVYKKTYQFHMNKYVRENMVHYMVGKDISYYTGINPKEELIETKTFKEVNISMPLLNVGDTFYFEDEDKIIVIKDVIRTDKDNVLYIINKEIIEDEESLKTAKEMQDIFVKESLAKIDEYDALKISYDGLGKDYSLLKQEYEQYKLSSDFFSKFKRNKVKK